MTNTSNISTFRKLTNSNNKLLETPALTQGEKYKKYQKKIKQNVKNKVTEGFSLIQALGLDNMKQDSLAVESNNIIKSNNYSSQTQTLSNLRAEYAKTLEQYKQLQNSISGESNQYIDRVNPTNPYLNKTIRFTTGHIAYVTNKGVVKYIPTGEVWKSCGAPQDYVQLDIPWNDSWNNVIGQNIPTNPPLISGTFMQAGQSIGNEGVNVYVNNIINNPQPTYSGCYADNLKSPKMNFIGDSPPTEGNLLKNGNFSQPQIPSGQWKYMFNENIPGWDINAVLVNSADAWGYPQPYPAGNQCLCIQMTQAIVQTVQLQAGVTYTMSFLACGRNCCDGSGQSNLVNITLDNTDNVTEYLQIYSVQPDPTKGWTNYSTTFTAPMSQNYNIWIYGTWSQGDRSTAFQQIQLTESGSNNGGSYTWSSCEQSAIDQGYRYFSLQNVNTSTAQGYCAVSNSQPTATSLGESYIPSGEIALWSSNTSGQPGNYAQLSQNGSISVINTGGQAVFASDNSKATPGNYFGCYGDGEYRAMPLLNNDGSFSTDYGGDNWSFDYDKSLQFARQNNYTYFSTQATNSNGTNGQGGFTNDLTHAMKYGKASNCQIDTNGNPAGNAWSNAIYSTNNTSHYFLILQDDGNMCIYRGSGPNDIQGTIWCTMTNGQQKVANPNYAAKKGKYGKNWMPLGSILMAGDFLGSNDGKIALIMQSDGNLVLYTFQEELNCQKMSDGNMGGGISANALYDIGKVGIPGNVGKLAYVDQNSSLFNYDSTQLSNTYSVIQNYDSAGYDIPGAAYGNATVANCQNTCTNNPDCTGFAYQKTTNTCFPKTSDMYPVGQREKNDTVDIYIRQIKPINPPIGIPEKTNYVDSITYQNYLNGGAFSNAYGIAQITSEQQAQLDQLESRLNLLSKQINKYTDKFGSGSQNAEQQMNKNVTGLGNYLTDLNKTDKKIKNFNTNIDNILSDSDISTLQKNYEYLFWSILAVGTVLISMNVVKK